MFILLVGLASYDTKLHVLSCVSANFSYEWGSRCNASEWGVALTQVFVIVKNVGSIVLHQLCLEDMRLVYSSNDQIGILSLTNEMCYLSRRLPIWTLARRPVSRCLVSHSRVIGHQDQFKPSRAPTDHRNKLHRQVQVRCG